MRRPWYSFLYVRSPIAKILWGIIALGVTIVLLFFQLYIEEPRMAAQTANWDGRAVEQGATLFANNCSSCHGADGKGLPGVAPALNSRYFFTQRLSDIGYAGSLHDYVAGTVAAGRPSNAISQWAAKMPTWGTDYGGPLRNDQVDAVTRFVLNWEADALQQTPEEDPWQPFQNAPTTTISGTVEMPGATSEQTGERAPADLYVSMGCMGCHNINEPQTDTNRGPVGPNLGNIHETAATRVPGEDAQTYVHNSIVNPNAHLSPGYSGGLMPQNFQERMSEREIQLLTDWILNPDREQ
jgi:cytochrome c